MDSPEMRVLPVSASNDRKSFNFAKVLICGEGCEEAGVGGLRRPELSRQ
jgi:hypothetical protein